MRLLMVVIGAMGLAATARATDEIRTSKDAQKRLDQERARAKEAWRPTDPWKGKTHPEDYSRCLNQIQTHHGKLIADAMERKMWARHRKQKLTAEERKQWKLTISALRSTAFTGPDTEPISVLDELGEEELRKIAGKITAYANRVAGGCKAK